MAIMNHWKVQWSVVWSAWWPIVWTLTVVWTLTAVWTLPKKRLHFSILAANLTCCHHYARQLAREGVEYKREIAQGIYRGKPLKSKSARRHSAKRFSQLTQSASCQGVHKHLYYVHITRCTRASKADVSKLKLSLMERLVKALKSHIATIGFVRCFVYGFVPTRKNGVIVLDE